MWTAAKQYDLPNSTVFGGIAHPAEVAFRACGIRISLVLLVALNKQFPVTPASPDVGKGIFKNAEICENKVNNESS